MVTLQYDPKKSVNHGAPGSSPGEGADIKVKGLYFDSMTLFVLLTILSIFKIKL